MMKIKKYFKTVKLDGEEFDCLVDVTFDCSAADAEQSNAEPTGVDSAVRPGLRNERFADIEERAVVYCAMLDRKLGYCELVDGESWWRSESMVQAFKLGASWQEERIAERREERETNSEITED